MNTDSLELNGNTLGEYYRDRLVIGLRYKYLLTKSFSIWLMLATGFVGIRTFSSYLFDDEFNEGLFQYLPVKLIVMMMTVLVIGGVFIAGYKLYLMVIRLQKPAEQGEFIWHIGHLTDKERVIRRHSTSSYFLYIDGERCVPLGFDSEEFQNAVLGDEFIVIRFIKSDMLFALKP